MVTLRYTPLPLVLIVNEVKLGNKRMTRNFVLETSLEETTRTNEANLR
jgi:hypothetical protein